MDRRDFLAFKRKAGMPVPPSVVSVRGINAGLNPYSGAWTTKEIAHLLKRTMFGSRKADIDHFRSMTPGQAVDALLNVSAVPPVGPLKDYDNTGIAAGDADLSVAMGSTWANTVTRDGMANGKRSASLKAWWIGLMLNQDRTILEKMTLFWHNHFATEINEYGLATLGHRYNALLRKNALGNFKQFVRDITLDGAMLRYLNGYLNHVNAPDENYARELQELFTLGKENNPNYTESDVIAAARVLTGWRIKQEDESIYFNIAAHDKAGKQFSSFYNNASIAGRTDALTAGDAELDDLLNMIFSKSVEVSEFMVRKLYRWFCYYSIDAATETNVIKPLAQQFRDSNWEIKPMLSTLLKSEHFFDPLNQGCLIKSPVDHIVGMCREFNVVFPGNAEFVDQYNMWDRLREISADMLQGVFDPPSVSGWSPYYQMPTFHEIWINTDTLPKRNKFTDEMIGTGFTENGKTILIDAVAFTKTLPNPSDPNQLINDVLDIMYRVPLSDQSKQIIKQQILLSNQTQDYYWTNAWNLHLGSPGDATAYNVVNTRLRDLYKYFMNLAEYQLA